MSSARQKLLHLLAVKSFRLGKFKLSSGGTSDYYIDCRTTTLDARGSQLTGQVFLEEIRSRRWKPQAIGGLTMGADPVVVAVTVTSGKIRSGDVMVIRYEGPRGGPGMREMLGVTGAIVGARNAKQVEGIVGAAGLKLTPAEIAEIEGAAVAAGGR